MKRGANHARVNKGTSQRCSLPCCEGRVDERRRQRAIVQLRVDNSRFFAKGIVVLSACTPCRWRFHGTLIVTADARRKESRGLKVRGSLCTRTNAPESHSSHAAGGLGFSSSIANIPSRLESKCENSPATQRSLRRSLPSQLAPNIAYAIHNITSLPTHLSCEP